MNKFTSFLAPLMQAYAFYQKASGRWSEASSYKPNLILFDRYCKKQYPEAALLSQEMVNGWCHQRDTESNNSCRSRINVVVSFIRYLRKRGKTNVMEPEIPRKERCTYIPHSFTDVELKNFFHACDSLPSVCHGVCQHSCRLNRIFFVKRSDEIFTIVFSLTLQSFLTSFLDKSRKKLVPPRGSLPFFS